MKQKKTTSEKSNLQVVHSPNKTLKSYQSGRIIDIPLDQIDFSPFNDRDYTEDDLQTFAKEIDRNNVQVPIMVRPVNGRLELIYGERRTRASKIAGRQTIPAFIRKGLTDEEVMYIQILENFDRKDLHPMDLANSFNRLKQKGNSEREIALRLGRSKSFVVSRLKLILLTEDWQRIYRLNKMDTFQAFEVASLSAESQGELFQTLCRNWKDKHFKLQNLEHYIARFKYKLKSAPFDIKDKTLYPEAGACIGCPHNSATFRTLFPDYSKDGVCSKKECFQEKCTRNIQNQFAKSLMEEQPDALVIDGSPSELIASLINQSETASQLPQFDQSAITILEEPEEPNKEDYMEDYYDGDPEFDEEGYKVAVEDYNEEMEEYNQQKGTAKKGLIVHAGSIKSVLFLPEKKVSFDPDKKVTNKEVTLAIKNGTITKEMLLAEKQRILTKADRDLELDEEKVMEVVYDQFETKVDSDDVNVTLTNADKAAIAYLIFLQVGYGNRHRMESLLLPDKSKNEKRTKEEKDKKQEMQGFYEAFNTIDSQKLCLLARKVILNKTECKMPSNPLSQFLYKMAKEAGVDVEAIEQKQQQKAAERQERQKQKILDVDRRIKKLETKESAQEDENHQAAEDLQAVA